MLRSYPIKQRLLLNGAVVGIAMLVMLALLIIQNSQLSNLASLRLEVNELKANVLELRKHEKDFIMRQDKSYLDKFDKTFQGLEQQAAIMRADLQEHGLDIKPLDAFNQQTLQYQQQFKLLVSTSEQVGLDPQSGLYGTLRKAAHSLENQFKTIQNDKMMVSLLQLRRAEKDFMLRADLKYLDSFDKEFSNFQSLLTGAAVSAEFQGAANDYAEAFRLLVKGRQTIGLKQDQGVMGDMRQAIHATEASLASMAKATDTEVIAAQARAQWIAIGLFLVVVCMVMTLLTITSRSIIEPIHKMCQTIGLIRRDNDFRQRVQVDGRDEMSQLAVDFNEMLNDFQNLVKSVNQALEMLDTATAELAKSTSDTSRGMHQQQLESDMVATAATEMGATIEEIAHHTENTANKAGQTNKNALEGRREVEQTVARISALSQDLEEATAVMTELERDSQTIGSVLDVIRGIAEQTNLLALNAAIEAARAGEQGRGFAVVADEVRSLAQRTADSTRQIEQIIRGLQTRTRDIVQVMASCREQGQSGVEQAGLASRLLVQISTDVDNIMQMTTQIATAVEEQSHVAGEVNKNVVRIRDISEESLKIADQNAQISEEVAEQAAKLHQTVDRFRA